jgi:hypothetical protein
MYEGARSKRLALRGANVDQEYTRGTSPTTDERRTETESLTRRGLCGECASGVPRQSNGAKLPGKTN